MTRKKDGDMESDVVKSAIFVKPDVLARVRVHLEMNGIPPDRIEEMMDDFVSNAVEYWMVKHRPKERQPLR